MLVNATRERLYATSLIEIYNLCCAAAAATVAAAAAAAAHWKCIRQERTADKQ